LNSCISDFLRGKYKILGGIQPQVIISALGVGEAQSVGVGKGTSWSMKIKWQIAQQDPGRAAQ